jgi:thiazole synthase ThiGH ThiG subunit
MAVDTSHTPKAMAPDPLVIADRTFTSRLIVGTGKYPSHQVMSDAHAASATEMVTVAVRRLNFTDRSTESLIDYIDRNRIFLLPNTAGCSPRRMRFARPGWGGKSGCRTGSSSR